MTGKKFYFRIDGDNKVGIREVISQAVSQNGTKYGVNVGVTADLKLSNQYIVKDNAFVKEDNSKDLRRGKGSKSIYYKLDELSYIVVYSVNFDKEDNIQAEEVVLYVPQSQCSVDEIYAYRQITGITATKKQKILEEVRDYAMARVNVQKNG